MAKTEGKPGMNYKDNAARAEPTTVDPTTEAMASLAGAQGMTRTQVNYQTAISVQKKRDMVAVIKAIEFEAGEMGESFCYSWRQKCRQGAPEDEGDGHTTIEGMSINGAMILVRCFGNAALPTELLTETPSHFYFVSTFIDLETGFTLSRTFRQRKSGGPGGAMGDDRKSDIAYQIGQSKSARNVVDKAMPSWLRDRAIECAKSTAAKKYENVAEWVPLVIGYYGKIGVEKAALERYLSRPATAWSKFDILKLQMLAKAIKEKETTIDEAFAVPDEPPQAADGGAQGKHVVTVDTTGTVTVDTTQEKKEPEGKPEPSPFDDLPPEASKTTTAATTTAEKKPGDAPTQQSTTPSSVEDVRAKLAGQQVKS